MSDLKERFMYGYTGEEFKKFKKFALQFENCRAILSSNGEKWFILW